MILSLQKVFLGQTLAKDKPWNTNSISMVDLLVLTCLNLLILVLKILFDFVTKQTTLMRRSTVLSLPLQKVFPGQTL
jgi:hypothetical protein